LKSPKHRNQLAVALKDIKAFQLALRIIPKNYKVVRRMIEDELDICMKRKEDAVNKIIEVQEELKRKYQQNNM
jgi:hypothetical protein